MSLRTDGKHTSVAVTMDTRERLRSLAGSKPIYEYLDELTLSLTDGSQGAMRTLTKAPRREPIEAKFERLTLTSAGFLMGFIGLKLPERKPVGKDVDVLLDEWLASMRIRLREALSQERLDIDVEKS